MKLYKFRSIGDEGSFKWAKDILVTGQFYCSPLWELNDPMEGVYSYAKSDEADVVDVFSLKNRYRICSFSAAPALKEPTLWGYYANGFRGVAIEVEVEESSVCKVAYEENGAEWLKRKDKSKDEEIRRIITTKLSLWQTEEEYRFLVASPGRLHEIGTITAVYFGDPYYRTENMQEVVDTSEKLQIYCKLKKQLVDIAKGRSFSCYSAGIDGRKVVWKPLS